MGTGRHRVAIFFPLLFLSSFLICQEQRPFRQWKIEVSAASAVIHLNPDASSPVVGSLPRGTVLVSYAKEGAWLRVIHDAGGVVIVGFISAADVVSREETPPKGPDFGESESENFRGAGIIVRAGGGLNAFQAGDIDRGAAAMFASGVQDLGSRGYILFDKDVKPFRSGISIAGEVIKMLSPRLGVAAGVDYLTTSGGRFQSFGLNNVLVYTFVSEPKISTVAVRIGVRGELPLSRGLKVMAGAGPSINFADYSFNYGFSAVGLEDSRDQIATARTFGAWGSLGLELALTSRTGLFVEAQGRYARFTDFSGSERTRASENGVYSATLTDGHLYLVPTNGSSMLAVLPAAEAEARSARLAVFDLTGVTLSAGIVFRF